MFHNMTLATIPVAILFALFIFGVPSSQPILNAPIHAAEANVGTEENPAFLTKAVTLKLTWDPYTSHFITKAQCAVVTDPALLATEASWSANIEVEDKENSVNEILLFTHIQSLPDATYVLYVRVSAGDLVSDWSDPLYTIKNWQPPDKPGGCWLSW